MPKDSSKSSTDTGQAEPKVVVWIERVAIILELVGGLMATPEILGKERLTKIEKALRHWTRVTRERLRSGADIFLRFTGKLIAIWEAFSNLRLNELNNLHKLLFMAPIVLGMFLVYLLLFQYFDYRAILITGGVLMLLFGVFPVIMIPGYIVLAILNIILALVAAGTILISLVPSLLLYPVFATVRRLVTALRDADGPRLFLMRVGFGLIFVSAMLQLITTF